MFTIRAFSFIIMQSSNLLSPVMTGPFPVGLWPPVPIPVPCTPGENPFPPGIGMNPVPLGPKPFPPVPPGLEPPITGMPSMQRPRYSSTKNKNNIYKHLFPKDAKLMITYLSKCIDLKNSVLLLRFTILHIQNCVTIE